MSDHLTASDALKLMLQEGSRTQMSHVMIRCAESGEGVPTGISFASLMTSDLLTTIFRCPHCHQEHTWLPGDAWIEDAY
jgi:hypothetical protein